MGAIADPIGVGAVSSLAHPGGNVTGFSTQNFELEEKRFELLRELVPGMARMTMLGNAANPYSAVAMKHVKKLAEAAGLSFEGVNIDEAGGLQRSLDSLRRAHPDGVLITAAPALFPYRSPIAEFMAANQLPAVNPFREFAEAEDSAARRRRIVDAAACSVSRMSAWTVRCSNSWRRSSCGSGLSRRDGRLSGRFADLSTSANSRRRAAVLTVLQPHRALDSARSRGSA
jgi:hypothetical protein